MRSMYADPVGIKGVSMSPTDLATGSRVLAGALGQVSREVIEYFESGDKVAVAFRLRGVHAGPLPTSVGLVPAPGQSRWSPFRDKAGAERRHGEIHFGSDHRRQD